MSAWGQLKKHVFMGGVLMFGKDNLRPFALAAIGGTLLLGGGAYLMTAFSHSTQTSDWAYQLQKLNVDALKVAPADILVIDYARDGSDETAFTREEVDAIRQKPGGGQRIVLAYLSIGEAENYRYYWKEDWEESPPRWLGSQNGRYKNNYIVKFWHKRWQRRMFGKPKSYLDKIIAAGFDGVYLDRIDVYWEWKEEHKKAERDMIKFVTALAEYARSKKPGFLVVAQNAEELVGNKNYRDAIDGIAKEDLTFGAGHRKSQRKKPDEISFSKKMLDLVKSDDKLVLVVEYIDNPADIAEARQDYQKHGYLSYFGPRSLDRITRTSKGPEG